MDADGIDAAFLYLSIGLFSGAIHDPQLAAAVCRSFLRVLAHAARLPFSTRFEIRLRPGRDDRPEPSYLNPCDYYATEACLLRHRWRFFGPSCERSAGQKCDARRSLRCSSASANSAPGRRNGRAPGR
jgi:hypothetical protein